MKSKNRITAPILILLLTITIPAFGQTLTGIVRLGADGDPAENVLINTGESTVYTASDGTYAVGVTTGTTISLRAVYAQSIVLEKTITIVEGTNYMNFWFAPPAGLPYDFDNNYYETVDIGDQKWLRENLKTTHFIDGTAISIVSENDDWFNLTTPGYCWYDNDPGTYMDDFGALYNWYTVNSGNVCPNGYHVPSNDEWLILFDYLGGTNVAGGKLKTTGTLEVGDGLWYAPNEGATNETGFTGLPSGYRTGIIYEGAFGFIHALTMWWSTTEFTSDPNGVYSPQLGYIISNVSNNLSAKEQGLSVRCVQNSPPPIATDSLALVDLYNSTDGDNWIRNDNWLTENVDTWQGVIVSGGRVTGLHLNKNNLTGTLPPSIGDLSQLAVLDLWTNNLNGSIPSEIGNLSNLTRLYLNNNELTGPIPVEIGQLTNLTYLYLNGNRLSGIIPNEIADLSSLTILSLGSNQLTGGIPPVLGSMTSLEQLSLPLNQLGGTIPSELGNLDNLEYLILKDNQLSGNIPPEIWGLSNLKQLHVGINNLEGTIPPEIGNLTNMLLLQLYSNQFSGELPSEIGNLENLFMLNINSNDFTGSVPSEITNLTSLRVFNIKDNQFSSLPVLSALTTLDSLFIDENMFTFKDIEPNIGVAPIFTYSPQANIETESNVTTHLGEEAVFTVNAGGTNSEYQWSKNGEELGIPSSNNTLIISPVNLTDAGDYGCYVTNSVAPDLILQADPATLDVINAIQVINTNDAGPGSLRYAIEFANIHTGKDNIWFNIDGSGPHIIQPLTTLPPIHDPVIIDGYTQDGASPNTNLPDQGMNSVLLIELDGSNLVEADGQGFIVSAGNSTIRGLVLNRFAHRGISLWEGSGNLIEGNYIGTNISGTSTTDLGIGTFGIEISGSDNNTIRENIVSGNGGTDPNEPNSGIIVNALEEEGMPPIVSTGNHFLGNYIGTDVTGTLPLPNNGSGINIGDSPDNTVGGTDPADRNIIYGGIGIGGNDGTTGNRVVGNYIGPDVTGNVPIGPPLMGVVIGGEASENEIGPGNVISGNGGGVLIGEGTSANLVFGNYIGVNALGTVALPNSSTNIIIENSPGNTIGGPEPDDGNVISGTEWDCGILITGSSSIANKVINNFIGTNATGTAAIGNESNGVVIQEGASDNIIGGYNLISGNGHSGVSISGTESTGNQVINNLIGTNTTGDALISNGDDGVNIYDAPDNVISGNVLVGAGRAPHPVGNNGIEILGASASGNIISNNYIGTNANNQTGLGNGFQGIQIKRDAHHNMIGPDNVISGNQGNGVLIEGDTGWEGATSANDNEVFDNFIGTNTTGTAPLPNNICGIVIKDHAANNIIGPGNVIAGNGAQGIIIEGIGSSGNIVTRNYIGTNAAGDHALIPSTAGTGVNIIGAANNIIGPLNVISGNNIGIDIHPEGEPSPENAAGNRIIGNKIGTNADGTEAVPNTYIGINMPSVQDNTIGGLEEADRNIISGNTFGIVLAQPTGQNNVVQGNYIGTDVTGTESIGNDHGIWIGDEGNANIIGGNTPETRNVISGNFVNGVSIVEGSFNNTVQGNFIGLKSNGSGYLGNQGHGIAVDYGSDNTLISNIIAGNNNHGIFVNQGDATSSQNNTISQNSIYENGSLGIELGTDGVTMNDENDADNGPNNLQNYPVLNSVGFSPGHVSVSGYLKSEKVTDYHLEFFANMTGDPSYYGEGETYLGSIIVQTGNDSGYVFFEDVFPVVGFPGQFITATATDPSGNTSEFSASLGGIKTQILAAMQQPFIYKINEEGLPGIRDGDDIEAINNSFTTWTDIPTADLVFEDGGTTPDRYASARDGTNLVTFTDNKFPMPPGVLAISAKTLRIVPGEQVAEILDADIVFNPAYVDAAEYYFGISDGSADSKIFDIESITTHEIGHAMGLVHTGIPLSTMFYALGTDILNRTLEADDLAWASYRYPGAGVDDAYGSISGQVTYGEMPLGTDPESYPPVAGALVLALNKENFVADPSNTSLWFHTYTDAEGKYKLPVEASSVGTEYYVHIQALDGDVFGFDLRPGNISAYIYINTIYTDYPDEMYNANDGPEDVGDPLPVVVKSGLTTTDINLVTNVDTEPPFVEDATASPVDNNGKLITRPEFFIYFNEAVDLNSFTAENCYLEYEVDEVAHTIGGYYDYFDVNSKDVILFKPDELEYNKDHILHVKNITDLKNNVDPAYEYIHPKPFSTTKADGKPPKVDGVLPDGKSPVFITDTILVFFSEPMDETSVIEAFSLSHPGDQDIAGKAYLNPDYDMLTFVPSSSLLEGEVVYTITVDHTAADFQGNPLGTGPEHNFTSTFTTVAVAAPLVMYLGPENGELDVTVETPVVVDFSEPIDRETVSSETFSLTSADAVKVNGSFEFLFNDSRVVFRPDKSLDFSTQYAIELAAGEFGIYDKSAVRLPLDPGDPKRIASFTTANVFTIPFLEYLDPVSGVDGALVKVAGSGFDPVPENNVVVFNGSEALVTDATLHSLTTKVPGGAISGSVPVIVNGIASSNSKYFSIIPQSLDPCAEPIENANTGSRSRSTAIAPDAASAYVTNYWDNTITAIKIHDDGHLEALFPAIIVGNNPLDIDINSEGTRAYVTNYSSHTVSVIEMDKTNPDLSYRSKDISVGVNPHGIAVSPDKKVYVANYESKNVSVIDADPNSGGFDHVIANVNTGSRNRSIAISQDAAIAVVTGDNGVNIIEFAKSGIYADALVTNASAGTRTRDAAINPDAGLAVVTTEDGDVLVIDIYPGSEYFGTVIANANTGSRSRDVTISQDALFVYISGVSEEEGVPDVVEVWKLTLGGGIGGGDASSSSNLTLEWHADIPLVDELGFEDGIDPEGIAIDPYGQRLYIVNTKPDAAVGQMKVVRICCGPIAQEKLVGDLFSIIQNLVSSGVLNDGLANALTVKLDKALTDLAKGKTKVAINGLNSLINHILGLMDDGVLTEEQAYGMINKINAILADIDPKKSAYAYVGVEEIEVPNESSLGPIIPNPFKHSTMIHYEVLTADGSPVRVLMSVINGTGQVVAHLVDQVMNPGQYTVEWNGRYPDDRIVAEGVYFVRFTAGRIQLVEKAVVIK